MCDKVILVEAAYIAAVLRMDPVAVLNGDEYDLAIRRAAVDHIVRWKAAPSDVTDD